MDKRSIRIKTTLFGYDKSQVDKQFREDDLERRHKLEAVRHQIDVIKEKNKQLEADYSSLEQEETALIQSERLIRFCSTVSKKIFALIDKTAENEISQIARRGEELERIYDIKIHEYSEEIKKTKEQLNKLLGVVVSKSENIYEEIKNFTKQYNANIAKDFQQANTKPYESPYLPYNETSKQEDINETSEEQYFPNGFWEDDFNGDGKIKEFTHEDKQETDEEAKLKDNEEVKGIEEVETHKEAEISQEVKAETIQEVKAEAPQEVKTETTQENKKPNVKSKAVSGEIENLRYKYLVGKIVGEDILDSNGNTIIRKNNKITVDVIHIAEKEGRLSELIINMILPEND